jgi:hypothetical protein
MLLATSRLGAWTLVGCWGLVIVTLMVQPGAEEIGRGRLRVDPSWLGHVIFFGVLAFLLANGFVRHGTRRLLWWSVVITMLFGIGSELLQLGVDGRTPSINDLIADLIGASLGAMVFAFLLLRNQPVVPPGAAAENRSGPHDGAADSRIESLLVPARDQR